MRDMIKLCAECPPAGEVSHGTPVMICEHGQATPVRQADDKPRHTCEEWCHCRKCGGFKMGYEVQSSKEASHEK
jgi:hypothetical protein